MMESGSVNELFFNRDLSWLSFNGRILKEAGKAEVPLLERIHFLAIFSSNLDEFYRVRMPTLSALRKIKKEEGADDILTERVVYKTAKARIKEQLTRYGETLERQILPELKEGGVHLLYNEPIPESIAAQAEDYFYDRLASFLEITILGAKPYFPDNNQLYFVFTALVDGEEEVGVVNIPSGQVSRFHTIQEGKTTYVLFIDDIIRKHIPDIFPDRKVTGIYSVKVTRDAELELDNEFEGSLAAKIEKQIRKRDFGLATRFLYPPDLPAALLSKLNRFFNLRKSNAVKGGCYHHLKDFFDFPIDRKDWKYKPQPPLAYHFRTHATSIFDEIEKDDVLIHTPYQSYNPILRFFNEAALRHDVKEIFTSMYRVASDSKILHALISAVKNGKKVTVFVELKARFDEENNMHWGKKLKAAGVKVLYSIPNLKVHAKVALVTTVRKRKTQYYGLLSTGNLNEKTATVYADHILLTARQELLQELREVFHVLAKRRNKEPNYTAQFQHLLVAQFNLADRFVALIDREIAHAKKGRAAAMVIKVNNLEEKGMIRKLYEASQAGVKIQLIVRSICRIRPGVAGLSENIEVRRIVDRYLEHSRVFIFHNDGEEELYMGSADWMTRNLFHRIEVCFPLVDARVKKEIRDIINIQLEDDTSAEILDENLNARKPLTHKGIRAQERIYTYCRDDVPPKKELK